jgi:hypothetical protein
MLALDSPQWSELRHAYGAATGIPELLKKLIALPDDADDAEPWFSLWSALAHQGEVYSASFAAVPHVIEALASAPQAASEVYFHFPAWVEICRRKNAIAVPSDLEGPYFSALARLPELVAQTAGRSWDAPFAACALSAIAAAKGQHGLAEALLEMSSDDVIDDFNEWAADR